MLCPIPRVIIANIILRYYVIIIVISCNGRIPNGLKHQQHT